MACVVGLWQRDLALPQPGDQERAVLHDGLSQGGGVLCRQRADIGSRVRALACDGLVAVLVVAERGHLGDLRGVADEGPAFGVFEPVSTGVHPGDVRAYLLDHVLHGWQEPAHGGGRLLVHPDASFLADGQEHAWCVSGRSLGPSAAPLGQAWDSVHVLRCTECRRAARPQLEAREPRPGEAERAGWRVGVASGAGGGRLPGRWRRVCPALGPASGPGPGPPQARFEGCSLAGWPWWHPFTAQTWRNLHLEEAQAPVW